MIADIFIFFLLALLSGLFYPVFHLIIGAPKAVPDLSAGDGAQFVKTMEITKPGHILRRYGKWLCRRQNQWDKKHDKSLLHQAILPADMQTVRGFFTSYSREEDAVVISRTLVDGEGLFGYKWYIDAILLHGEVAHIEFYDANGKAMQSVFKAVFPNFDRSKIPLSIFKAMGLCGPCTTFWIMLTNLLLAFSIGLFSGPLFWLIVPAYGLAIWAQQTYDLE